MELLIFLKNYFLNLYILDLWPELETLVLDTFNPVRLLSISTVNTFDFLLDPLFWISLLGSEQ